jgi:hypothetical protein
MEFKRNNLNFGLKNESDKWKFRIILNGLM